MRPGLVAVGISLLVLGGATLAAVYLLPPSGAQNRDTTVILPLFVAGHAGGQRSVDGTDTSSGNLDLHWSSTTLLSVQFYDTPGCTSSGACTLGTPVKSWSSNMSGEVSLSGSLRYPFLMIWSNPGNVSGSFQAEAVESYHGATGLPQVTGLLVDGVVGSVLIVGGLAVFLGLFLRSGVYRVGRNGPGGSSPGPPGS